MIINVRFLLRHKQLSDGLYYEGKLIKLIRYTSYVQQCAGLCTIFFMDGSQIEIKDNIDIKVSKLKLIK